MYSTGGRPSLATPSICIPKTYVRARGARKEAVERRSSSRWPSSCSAARWLRCISVRGHRAQPQAPPHPPLRPQLSRSQSPLLNVQPRLRPDRRSLYRGRQRMRPRRTNQRRPHLHPRPPRRRPKSVKRRPRAPRPPLPPPRPEIRLQPQGQPRPQRRRASPRQRKRPRRPASLPRAARPNPPRKDGHRAEGGDQQRSPIGPSTARWTACSTLHPPTTIDASRFITCAEVRRPTSKRNATRAGLAPRAGPKTGR